MLTVFDIAKNFYNRESDMSLKKLQKLCWYAYSWYIALNNEPDEENLELLFNSRAEAWIHGPVFRDLYDDFRHNDCDKLKSSNTDLNSEIIYFLDEVYRVYGSYTGYQLESIAIQESPWKNARGDLRPSQPCTNYIDEKDVFEEYLNRN